MRSLLAILITFLVVASISRGDQASPFIAGGSDGTPIGNVGDRLKVDAAVTVASTVFAVSTTTDASGAKTTTGNSGWLDNSGFQSMSVLLVVSSVSGTSPKLDVEIQASEDQATVDILHDSRRFTAAGSQIFADLAITGRYRRFVWTISGTTPSFTLSITTTLKPFSSSRSVGLIRYADLALATNGAVSTIFQPQTCQNISVMLVRDSAGSGNAFVVIEGSNDAASYGALTTSQAIAPSGILVLNLSNYAFESYRAKTVNLVSGSNPADIYWHCN